MDAAVENETGANPLSDWIALVTGAVGPVAKTAPAGIASGHPPARSSALPFTCSSSSRSQSSKLDELPGAYDSGVGRADCGASVGSAELEAVALSDGDGRADGESGTSMRHTQYPPLSTALTMRDSSREPLFASSSSKLTAESGLY